MSAYNISFHGEIRNIVELLHFSVIVSVCILYTCIIYYICMSDCIVSGTNIISRYPGPSCLKLMMWLVNISLKL